MAISTLVFGEHGQVAQALKEILPSETAFLGREQADFMSVARVIDALEKHQPRHIVIASAYTAVDRAESERDVATQINATTPGRIGEWAKENRARVIHFSSDYVYAGTGEHFQSEDEPIAPKNHYGRTKAQGDESLLSSGADVWIFRTSWVYSHVGGNFVKTMLRLGKEREVLSVVGDQVGSPTSARELAKVVRIAIEKGPAEFAPGVYHARGSGVISWHGFAQEIFAQARLRGWPLAVREVKAIPTSEYPTPAVRPLNSRLSDQKLKSVLGSSMPEWQESLRDCLERLSHGN